MQFTDPRTHLYVEIQTKECTISPDERTRMQALLAPIGAAVRDFANSALWVNIVHHPRSQTYHAEFKLKLPGRTLLTGERDSYLDSAFERGVRKLQRHVDAYREHPDESAVHQAARRQWLNDGLVAPEDPELGPVGETVRDGDYRKFRKQLILYEEWLRKRVGRWVQRYPEAEARVGTELLLGDLVEEVYLNAFESWTRRPADVRISQWLDDLIDPSLKALLRHPDLEHENASFARSLRDGPVG